MERKQTIILHKGNTYESWGSLTELCKAHGFPYWTLARLKYPFEYKGYKFIKVAHNKRS